MAEDKKPSEEKKLVREITSMDEDFAQWYTDIVKKAELTDYSSVKGCMVIKPAGYAIWENIQKELDKRFKATGVQNCYMPLFIPESLLNKEKDHVEGFAPEVAWVTQGGLEPLQERLCVRPTSETLFCDYYAKNVHSYRDLPQLLRPVRHHARGLADGQDLPEPRGRLRGIDVHIEAARVYGAHHRLERGDGFLHADRHRAPRRRMREQRTPDPSRVLPERAVGPALLRIGDGRLVRPAPRGVLQIFQNVCHRGLPETPVFRRLIGPF